jgi:hypothetical protein
MPENSLERSRLEVPIPADLKRAFRLAARARGLTMSAAAREALRAFVTATAAVNDQRPARHGALGDNETEHSTARPPAMRAGAP